MTEPQTSVLPAAEPTLPMLVPASPAPAEATPTASETAPGHERLRPLRARALPARWRITAWIMLSTLFTLLAVGMIGRSLSLAEVEVQANTSIEQETAEFARFAREGLDPSTAEPFDSVARLLETYLDRQAVHDGEILVGLSGTTPELVGVRSGLGDSGWDPATHPADLARMTGEDARSGSAEFPDGGPARWGRVDLALGEETGSLLVLQFTAEARADVGHTIATLAWVGLAGLLLSSGVAWLVAGQILAPIRELHRVARDIGHTDLTARVPVTGGDDIAAVATTFNEMLDRLDEAHRTQQRFVDDAGHELRTPITIVRGHLELLSEDPDEGRETLRLVTEELARMSRIVTDLLVLARAQQPDFVTREARDIASLTLDIEAKAQALGERRWQLMEVAEGDAPVDAQRVTQAMLQLAANAVQVTRDGDRIRIGSGFHGAGAERRLRLWVQDEGPGVAAADAERIFERFVHGAQAAAPRGDTAGSSPRHGAGLGLAIVRAITDGHGGSAWLESEPGRGATFGLDLPAPAAPRSDTDAPDPALLPDPSQKD